MKTIENENELLVDVPELNFTSTIKDKEINDIKNWSCPVCDGDDETGCLLSDPQNCPYDRGI
ncbi:MAG: hypothetical protein KatS3mg028_0898 [Bacteroidia bacterium]|nr:MAG: hypothetical protein KatS3mg028_0866 [Bacteroidia bacterium]GIV29832.1 MAG: hypothetical protein KatS3mg028_0898 [Bacteroidia bacterium]